jgi:anthranilate phosphoribosyltransferase
MLPPEADARPAPQRRFAGYVRAIARGASLGRALTRGEAEDAMTLVLSGEAEPVQVGALLAVLRYSKETPEELAGFVQAARASFIGSTEKAIARLDWPSYADRHKQLPYFILSALLLAECGVSVLMHGIDGEGAATTPKTLAALGVPAARALAEAAERVAREINPADAPCQLQGVFHPTYLPTHLATAQILGQPRAAIFKGGAGEVQRNPEKACRTVTLHDGAEGEESWPALTPEARHAWREEPLDPARVVALWRGDWDAPGPLAAVLGTAAIALKLVGRAATIDAAEAEARRLWDGRPKEKYGRA